MCYIIPPVFCDSGNVHEYLRMSVYTCVLPCAPFIIIVTLLLVTLYEKYCANNDHVIE